jgi:hypothetical protein
LVTALSSFGCTRHDRRLQLHHRTLQSLGSSIAAVTEAWLAGHVSGTYTQTALEQTLRLIEQERTSIASKPETLIDPRGARLSDSADHLERVVAQIVAAVRAADGATARYHLASLTGRTGQEAR